MQHRPEGERALIQVDGNLPALAGLQVDLGEGFQFAYRPCHRALHVPDVDLDDLGTGYGPGIGDRDSHRHRKIAILHRPVDDDIELGDLERRVRKTEAERVADRLVQPVVRAVADEDALAYDRLDQAVSYPFGF